MVEHFGRPGRRADLARLLHQTLSEHGLAPRAGSCRALIDQKVRRLASEQGISEATALKRLQDRDILAVAQNTAREWHAAKAAMEAAGAVSVSAPAESVAQLVMGLAMAVGQLIREAFGELPASAGEPLDAICELGTALRETTAASGATSVVTLEALSAARSALLAAADGVAVGGVPAVVGDDARPGFARQLYADAALAQRLQP